MYTLRVTNKNGSITHISNVLEFTSGYMFFHVTQNDGKAIAIDRSNIVKVERRLNNGSYKEVKLIKIKKKIRPYIKKVEGQKNEQQQPDNQPN